MPSSLCGSRSPGKRFVLSGFSAIGEGAAFSQNSPGTSLSMPTAERRRDSSSLVVFITRACLAPKPTKRGLALFARACKRPGLPLQLRQFLRGELSGLPCVKPVEHGPHKTCPLLLGYLSIFVRIHQREYQLDLPAVRVFSLCLSGAAALSPTNAPAANNSAISKMVVLSLFPLPMTPPFDRQPLSPWAAFDPFGRLKRTNRRPRLFVDSCLG